MTNFKRTQKYLADFIKTFFLLLSLLLIISVVFQSAFSPLVIPTTLAVIIYGILLELKDHSYRLQIPVELSFFINTQLNSIKWQSKN